MHNSLVLRERIIGMLTEGLHDSLCVNALWLEGADGTGDVDEYSDIDIWLDVNDGEETRVFALIDAILSPLGEFDLNHLIDHQHPKLRQKFYHIKGTSEYLILDVCIQLHSRNKKECCFVDTDTIEVPKIIFDRANIISFRSLHSGELKGDVSARLPELENTYAQHSRVEKYVKRGQFLEAFAYYEKYVLGPLVEVLRMKYTPLHYSYGPVHISRHLPAEVVRKLEELYKIGSIDEISRNSEQARKLFAATVSELHAWLEAEEKGDVLTYYLSPCI